MYPLQNKIINQSQNESQQQILLPMCSILPANNIISKNYQPDSVATIKLITRQQLNRKQEINKKVYLNNLPKNVLQKNYQFIQYGNIFNTNDYLGRFYDSQYGQMIYLKFNNKDYNQIKINQKKCRFFSGMFIQPDQFIDILQNKKENKQHESSVQKGTNISQNIMKNIPFLNFLDYNTNILQSFGKNTTGNSFDPKFSSNYDSANLFAVFRKKPFQYDLILQNDINSKGNTQWFNFLVNFTQEGLYKFNIVNFTKNNSLYQNGMKIACYSYHKQSIRGSHQNNSNQKKIGNGWFRTGQNIKYYKNNIQREGTQLNNESYYTLSFEYNCKNKLQSIIFAHSIPYTNLDLQKYFNKILYRRVFGNVKMQKIFICNSLAGQPIFCYMIAHRKINSNMIRIKKDSMDCKIQRNSSKNSDKRLKYNNNNFSRFQDKCNSTFTQYYQEPSNLKSIVLMARQHSGQTQSSFVLEGMVDYLITNNQLDSIKKNYLFFIFPMINIDGVKYGHYRTNLCGTDLNRIWRVPKKQFHPQVYYTKKFLYELNRNHTINFILDIHGHSKLLNSFFYGNPCKKQNNIIGSLGNSFDDPKIFPYICSKRIKQISYKQSTFSIKQDKKNSARVVLSQMFPKALVYTFQNSFYGYQSKKLRLNIIKTQEDKPIDSHQIQNQVIQQPQYQTQIIEYTSEIFRKIGRQLLTTYLQYTRLCQKNSSIKAKWMKQMQLIYSQMQKQKSKQVFYNKKNSIQPQDDGGSDSQIENQLIEMIFKQKKVEKQMNIRKINKSPTLFKTQNQIQKFIERRSQKKKTMPLPKTICQQTVQPMSSLNKKMFSTLKDLSKHKINKINKIYQQVQNRKGRFQNNSCFNKNNIQVLNQDVGLSIFKIETLIKSNFMKKKKSSIMNNIRNQCQQQKDCKNIQYRNTTNNKINNVNQKKNILSMSIESNNNKQNINHNFSKKVLLQQQDFNDLNTKRYKNRRNDYKKQLFINANERKQNDQKSSAKNLNSLKLFLKSMGITIQNNSNNIV